MSISGVTSTANLNQAAYTSPFAQAKQDMQALGTALSSGNLSDAQNAFAQLQQNLPASSGTTTSQNSDSPGQAIQNIGSALQSGNITDAQQAFAKLQAATKGAGKGHHHHHKAGASQGGGATAAASKAGTTQNSTQPSTYSASGFSPSSSDNSTASGESQTTNITIQIDISA
jgi:hypothetical protein